MGFPWLLLGGLAAGIPVALHFFFRSRYRVVPWAAMDFLLTSIQMTSRRIKFQELLLLLLRVDLLLLLAVALAQPLVGGTAGNPPLDVVVIVDNSYSMGAREGVQQSRLDLAKKEAIEVIKSLPPSSTVHVVTCSDRAELLGPPQVDNRELAIQTVEGIKLSSLSTDFQPGFLKAAEVLKDTHHSNREVYLFSDMQALGWERQANALRSQTTAMRQQTADLKSTRLVLVRCGTEEPANAAVVGLQPHNRLSYLGEQADFDVFVQNTGKKPLVQLHVGLFIDGKQTDEQAVDNLNPSEKRVLVLRGEFKRAGLQAVTATIDPDKLKPAKPGGEMRPPDGLEGDDRLDLVVRVRDKVRVLVVDGAPDADPEKSASFRVRNALQPVPPADQAKYHVEVRTATLRTITAGQLKDRDVCVLTDVPAAPDPMALLKDDNKRWTTDDQKRWDSFLTALDAFVKEGHGLLLFCGPNVNAADYNRVLGGPNGVLPSKLGEPFAAEPDKPLRGDPDSVDPHAFLAKFREPAYARAIGQDLAVVSMAMSVDEPVVPAFGEAASVDFRYTNGKPAIMSRRVGRGRVVLCSTTGSLRWTLWPYASGMFVPLVQLSLAWLSQGAPEGANRNAGDVLYWSPPVADEGRTHELRTPDGETIKLGRPQMRGGLALYEIKDTSRSGLYTVTPMARDAEAGVANLDPDSSRRAPAGTLFAVNPDLEESKNLTALNDEEIDGRLGGKDNLYHRTAGKSGQVVDAASAGKRWPLTPGLLGALAALLVAELFMAWVCTREQAGDAPVWTVVLLVLIVVVVLQQLFLVACAAGWLFRPDDMACIMGRIL